MAAKKTTTGKTKKATKKPVTKKASSKKPAAKKAPTKKKATKKVSKKAPIKKTPAKKAAKKASTKTPAKKTGNKVAKKAPLKKVAKKPKPKKAAKTPAKKVAVKKIAIASKTVKKASAPAPAKPKKVTPARRKSSHSASFINKQKQRLLDLRDELVDSMSGMTRDTIRNAPEGSEASGSGQHQGDAGSDAYDRDFALSVLAKEQDALYEIEQALLRIDLGSYGLCEMSGDKIPSMRLEAIPFARLTVECQSAWEKEYGNRRFRPSAEVGFSGGNYEEDEDSDTVSLDEDRN